DGDETDEQRDARLERNAKRYWVYKAQLLRTTRSMVGRLVEIISQRPDNDTVLDVPAMLEELRIALELDEDDFDVETITSFLFAKKLLIGGDAYMLGAREVKPLLNKAPDLLEVALDALFMGERPAVPGDDLVVDIDKSRFLMELAKRARGMFFNYTNQNEVVLDFDNLINVLELVMEDVDWDRATDSLLNLKAKIIGGDERAYSYKD